MFSGCLSLSNVTTPVLMLSTIIPLRLPHHSPWLRYKSYSILPSQSSRLLSSSHQFAKTKLTRADRDECESKNYETLRHGRACRSARCADLKYRFRGPHDQHRLFRSCYFASVSRKYENLVASVWMIFSSISNLFVYKRPNSDSWKGMSVSSKKANRLPHVFACLSSKSKASSKCLMAGKIPRSSSHATARNLHINTSAPRRILVFHSPPTTSRSMAKVKKTFTMSVRQSTKSTTSWPRLSLSSESKSAIRQDCGRHDLASCKLSTRV